MSLAKNTERKNPWIAALLSFFIVGLGQIYGRQVGRGVVLFVLTVLLTITFDYITGWPISGILESTLIVLWVYNVYDAYKTPGIINSNAQEKIIVSKIGNNSNLW